MTSSRKLVIKLKGELSVIDRNDILCITHFNRKTRIITGSEEITTSLPLNKLEKVLNGQFIRTHRNYIVNIKYIRKIKRDIYGGYKVYFKGSKKFAFVSKGYYPNLVKKLRSFIWLS